MANLHQKSRLTFIKKTLFSSNPKALYKCECGNIKELFIANVKRNHTRSCGCFFGEFRPQTHGLTKHPLYNIWGKIKGRCYNSNMPDYYLYGGRGVVMCDEWVNNPEKFIEWAVSNGWRKGLRIDKDIKSKGVPMYSPETCSIVTNKENCNHLRANRVIEYNGERKTLQQWSEYFNVVRGTFRCRMKLSDWDIAKYISNAYRWRKP